MPKKNPKDQNKSRHQKKGARQPPKPTKVKVIKELEGQVDILQEEYDNMKKQLSNITNVVMELQNNSNQDARTIQQLSSRINGCFTFLSLSFDNIEKAIDNVYEVFNEDENIDFSRKQVLYEVLDFIREAQKYLMPHEEAMKLYAKIKIQTNEAEAELKKAIEEQEEEEPKEE